MKYFQYILLGFLVFWIIEFLAVNVGSPGPESIVPIVSAISLLCSIVVICTLVIVDTIKNNNH